MTTKSPSRDAALEILNGASSGHYARDVAAAVDMAPNHCAKLLQNLHHANAYRAISRRRQSTWCLDRHVKTG